MKIHDSWKTNCGQDHVKSVAQDSIAQLYHALSEMTGSVGARDALATAHGEVGRSGYINARAEYELIKAKQMCDALIAERERRANGTPRTDND